MASTSGARGRRRYSSWVGERRLNSHVRAADLHDRPYLGRREAGARPARGLPSCPSVGAGTRFSTSDPRDCENESESSARILRQRVPAGGRRRLNRSQGERHRSSSSRPRPTTTHPSPPARLAVATHTSRRPPCVGRGSVGNAPSPDRRHGGGCSTCSMDSSCRAWQVAVGARPTLCHPATGIEPACPTAYVRARTARAPLFRAPPRRQMRARRSPGLRDRERLRSGPVVLRRALARRPFGRDRGRPARRSPRSGPRRDREAACARATGSGATPAAYRATSHNANGPVPGRWGGA
jgi:hypothetical protein